VEKRSVLVADARTIDPKVVVEGKSDADIRRAVISAVFKDEDMKDRSDEYVQARFDICLSDKKASADGVRAVLKDGVVLVDSGDAWGAGTFGAAGVAMKKG
jgi:uncharacterized protein